MGGDTQSSGPESKHASVKHAIIKRPRLDRRVVIGAPVLAAVATAAVLSSQALSSSPVADVKPAPHKAAANLAIAAKSSVAASPSASATKMATAANAAAASKSGKSTKTARPARAQQTQLDRTTVADGQWYTVRSGDTLSGVAGRFYGQTSAWPVIYYANRGKISAAGNEISPGEVLRIPPKPAHIPAAPAAAPAPVTRAVQSTASTASAAQSTVSSSGGYPGGSFGACVVARESGGNPQVMNSSGHYGLYQFSYSTWVAYGGSPGDFGHASVAEQNQVFANALARGGESNWAPYDGC